MNMSHAKRRTIKRNTLKPDVAISRPKLSHKQTMLKTRRRIRKEGNIRILGKDYA